MNVGRPSVLVDEDGEGSVDGGRVRADDVADPAPSSSSRPTDNEVPPMVEEGEMWAGGGRDSEDEVGE